MLYFFRLFQYRGWAKLSLIDVREALNKEHALIILEQSKCIIFFRVFQNWEWAKMILIYEFPQSSNSFTFKNKYFTHYRLF